MPESWRYFSSSCSNSCASSRGPCSMTTTLLPASASSRATMPPAEPEPTTMKSTVSLVGKVLRSMWLLPSGGDRRGAGVGNEPCVVLVVIAEGRGPEVAVHHAEHLPARIFVVAAIFGQRDHAEHGQA